MTVCTLCHRLLALPPGAFPFAVNTGEKVSPFRIRHSTEAFTNLLEHCCLRLYASHHPTSPRPGPPM